MYGINTERGRIQRKSYTLDYRPDVFVKEFPITLENIVA